MSIALIICSTDHNFIDMYTFEKVGCLSLQLYTILSKHEQMFHILEVNVFVKEVLDSYSLYCTTEPGQVDNST